MEVRVNLESVERRDERDWREPELVYLVCEAEGEKSATGGKRGWFIWLVWSNWSVWLVSLLEPENQTNQNNQRNQMNTRDKHRLVHSTIVALAARSHWRLRR
jgi:hypothetical protein